uniref:Glycosyl hydrolase family 38 C-terminal domain-containing protein n=1 Tax=Lactuca sativa TaxID=4236 RepID=A0A9R1UME4_LACSA|nr:hypothetical protein LSAT_V11C800418090 [Lactuca sativa]
MRMICEYLTVNDAIALRNYYTTAYTGKSPSSISKYSLAFTTFVPPLGFTTYVISSTKKPAWNSVNEAFYKHTKTGKDGIEVGTGNLKLIYSGSEGKVSQYVNSRSSITAYVKQSYNFYAGFDGTTGEQISRVFKNKEHAEVEFTVGPIPVDDGVGKEIVTQITTTMKSNKTFYIDSNGRDFLQRIRDYREDWDLEVNQPIAGNYYPVNLGIYLKDETSELSLLVDRSVGGSSIVDGQLELMLHRLLYDDGKGVAEALNETVCVGNDYRGLTVQGKYYLRIDPIGEGAKWRRSYGQEIYSPLLLAFTEQDEKTGTNFQVSTFSGMDSSYSLPERSIVNTPGWRGQSLSVMTSVELQKLFAKRKTK